MYFRAETKIINNIRLYTRIIIMTDNHLFAALPNTGDNSNLTQIL